MTETDAKPFKSQTLGIASPPAAVPPPNTFNYEENQLVESYVDPIGELFKERKNLRIDKFEYDRHGDQAGLVLIFNQENFDDPTLGTRKGSRRDVNEITVCLQRQGFNIDPNNIFTDLTTSEITDKIKEVSSMDLADYNCLIIFFLSHGEEFNMLHTKDGTVLAQNIWQPFRLNKSLKNKPKMFILQACKGDKYSTTGTVKSQKSTEADIIVPTKTFQANSLYPDMVIFYSAIEGNFSFRNVFTGSWFIQELCKNFSAYGKRDDVISLLIRTTKCVAGNYYHKYEDEEKKEVVDRKQMPLFVSTLTKKFYLNRNKDRDTLLKIAESNEEILKNIKDIKLQFDKLLSKDEDKKKKK